MASIARATAFALVAWALIGCSSNAAPSGVPNAHGSAASPGCGTSSARAGTTQETMTVAGLARSWDLHVPAAHDGRTPLPLVVQLHGYGGGASDMAETGLETLGDREGFVLATPVGRDSKAHWLFDFDSPALDVTSANPDIAFMSALLDRLGADLCLDTSRIYVAGLSNGAWMTSALPCPLGDRIAAIAPVSGLLDFGADCQPDRPVPVIAFHGTADTILPIDGGFDPDLLAELRSDTGGSFDGDNRIWAVPIRERMTRIAVRDGCEPDPVPDQVSANSQRLVWTCPPDADKQLVVVDGGGHDWFRPDPEASDASPSPGKVDATRLMWGFFKEHPLPSPAP